MAETKKRGKPAKQACGRCGYRMAAKDAQWLYYYSSRYGVGRDIALCPDCAALLKQFLRRGAA